MTGNRYDSRQVRSRDEFKSRNDAYCSADEDFVPLQDYEYNEHVAMGDSNVRQSKESPGDPGSAIPGIEAFQDPSTNPKIANVFINVHFPYDSNLIKGDKEIGTVKKIAEYMKKNKNVYIFVEGHTDERGGEAYNLALGARRSNAIRTMLIDNGVSPDNIFTISYGKERPLVFGQNEDAWAQNRRGEFKVYFH
jgi:peptidoglycan-associated lipoprotein